jgi:hypothetical protein
MQSSMQRKAELQLGKLLWTANCTTRARRVELHKHDAPNSRATKSASKVVSSKLGYICKLYCAFIVCYEVRYGTLSYYFRGIDFQLVAHCGQTYLPSLSVRIEQCVYATQRKNHCVLLSSSCQA